MKNREHINSNKKLPKQDQSNFKRDEEIEESRGESEINPNKLNREQTKTDQKISENSKSHQPHELSQGNETENHERLLGQGGYGTKQQGSQSTKGTYDTSLRGSDGGVDGVRTGKASGKIKKNK